jgi:kynurenine 3-monooxygenase
MDRVIVAGGGLVGCAVSMFLVRRGIPVVIYERGADPRLTSVTTRPSINVTLCARGLRSLERLALTDRLPGLLMPAYGRMIHNTSGAITYQPYSESGDAIYCVARRQLCIALLNAAEERGVTLVFDRRVTTVDCDDGAIVLEDRDGHRTHDRASAILAADGCYSTIRRQLQRRDRFDYAQSYCTHGYKELIIPEALARAASLTEDALHLWPRHDFMALAFANVDRSFTCSIHLPFDGPDGFEALADDGAVRSFFGRWFADLVPLVPSFAPRFLAQPPNSMVTIRCWPWSARRVLLLGDAAHAMFPSYGQGANAGFQDCELLDELIGRHGTDWRRVFTAFESMRKPDTDAMADLCGEHFVELRERVDHDTFHRRCRVERELHRCFPDRFVPLYSMISFSSIGYAEARRRDAIQQSLVDALMRDPHIEARLREPAFLDSLSTRLGSLAREVARVS